MNELTEEQQADVEERKKSFLEDYTALTEKYQMDFSQFPMLVPMGNGLFGTVVTAELRDKKYLSPVSPIQS